MTSEKSVVFEKEIVFQNILNPGMICIIVVNRKNPDEAEVTSFYSDYFLTNQENQKI